MREVRRYAHCTCGKRCRQNSWKWHGVCKHCLAQGNKTNTITDVVGTSSNFSKHAKKHPVQYKEWETKKSMVFNSPGLKKAAVAVPGQLTLATAFAGIPKTYHKTHPKQVLITSSIVKNLVIGCGIPHYIVENPKFCGIRYQASDFQCKASRSRVSSKKEID